jgi:hypothetical protein
MCLTTLEGPFAAVPPNPPQHSRCGCSPTTTPPGCDCSASGDLSGNRDDDGPVSTVPVSTRARRPTREELQLCRDTVHAVTTHR